MVTKIVVRISPEGEEVVSAEKSMHDINGGNVDEICGSERGDYAIIPTQLCDIQGILNKAAAGGIICDNHSYNNDRSLFRCKPNDDKTDDEKEVKSCQQNNDAVGKKRPPFMDDTKKKRRKRSYFDLTGVPPQAPILKSNGKVGSSKYLGVSFAKAKKKWRAQLSVDGLNHCIGYYHDEEEAAVDYARAAFKCKTCCEVGSTLTNEESEVLPMHDKVETRKRAGAQRVIDLTDVPPQVPMRSRRYRKRASSNYQGVSFNKTRKKWKALIKIDGKQHFIGSYDNEVDAAVDYARAFFKYRTGRQQAIVLADDPTTQSPILKSDAKGGDSKYQDVTFDKTSNKWLAAISIDECLLPVGSYDDEEEPAINNSLEYNQYRAEIMQKGNSSSHKEAHQDNIRDNVDLNQSQQEAVSKQCNQKEEYGTTMSVEEKFTFPMEFIYPKNARLSSQGFMQNEALVFLSEESAMTSGKRQPTANQGTREGLSNIQLYKMKIRNNSFLKRRQYTSVK